MRNGRYMPPLRGTQKVDTRKLIIFHALGDTDRRGRYGKEDGASTSGVVLEERYPPKLKWCVKGRAGSPS